jgi:serine/threonine protein kinase/Flp pilus assembly protein TadD
MLLLPVVTQLKNFMALSSGTKLQHYEILSPLGVGGMGEVYRARDGRLRRNVAIKILPESWIQDHSAVERFIKEAHAVSALNHPNIITIYDIGQQDDIHFMATELVDGQTLRQHMKTARLKLPEALDVAIQVANALSAAHSAGIIHRDVKPENIMLRTDGYVKVLDFGLAKLTEHDIPKIAKTSKKTIKGDTQPGTIMGTARYMSPEQARGLDVDQRSDIFSFAIVIYEMIAGCLPFSGATMSDVIAAILKTEPTPLSQCVAAVPAELDWSVTKALRKDREERYQTIKSLLSDLRRLKQRLDFEAELGRVHSSSNSAFNEIVPPAVPVTEQVTLMLPQATEVAPKTVRKTRIRKVIDSLAVLPLVNATRDPNAEYLSDGITESIINSLSKLPKLRVVPRSTVFRYKGSLADPQEIGRELGVRAVFVGRVMHHGDFLIIKTELVDVAQDSQLWGEQYRRKITNIFSLQEEIAEDISEKLRLRLSGADKKRLAKRYTENSEAYKFYLKGRYFVTTKRTEEWIKRGIEHFQQAIDLDPNYALAYSGLADAYAFLASSTGGWSPREAYPKAKAAALKALEIDEALGEAHSSLGFFSLLYDWNFAQAEHEFKRAIELSPNYPHAHDGYGFYLKAMGQHEEAVRECLMIQQVDPLSPFGHVSLGWAYYFARQYDLAVQQGKKALEMDKHSAFAYWNLGLVYLQQEKLESAISALSKSVTFSDSGLAFEAHLGFAYAIAGKRTEAIEVLADLHENAKHSYVSAYYFAIIHVGLGETDEAFKWLEEAYEERSGFMPFLKVDPIVDSLRTDARFVNLLQRIGLEPRSAKISL